MTLSREHWAFLLAALGGHFMGIPSVFWKEGEAYHRTAIGAQRRRQVFNAEIIYNLLAMAIEKYFMAFFEANHVMPDNHTFTDLINSANRLRPLDAVLVADLKSLEILQDICPLYQDTQRRSPTEEQLNRMYDVIERVAAYCRLGMIK
jgi:hypothetical protein